jgi:hypothetical protein
MGPSIFRVGNSIGTVKKGWNADWTNADGFDESSLSINPSIFHEAGQSFLERAHA